MRALIALLVFSFSTGAFAQSDWVSVSQTEQATIYLRAASVRPVEASRQAEVLLDYPKPINTSVMSVILSIEARCMDRQMRRLKGIAYTAPMGGGEAIEADHHAQAWVDVRSGTVEASLLEKVCAP